MFSEHFQTPAGRCQQTFIRDYASIIESCVPVMEKNLEQKLMTIPDVSCGYVFCYDHRKQLDQIMTFKVSGAGQHPNCLTLMILPKNIFEKVHFENKNLWSTKSMQNYPASKALTEL